MQDTAGGIGLEDSRNSNRNSEVFLTLAMCRGAYVWVFQREAIFYATPPTVLGTITHASTEHLLTKGTPLPHTVSDKKSPTNA